MELIFLSGFLIPFGNENSVWVSLDMGGFVLMSRQYPAAAFYTGMVTARFLHLTLHFYSPNIENTRVFFQRGK